MWLYFIKGGLYITHIFNLRMFVCMYPPRFVSVLQTNIGDIFDTANICLRDFLDANVYCSKCTKKVINVLTHIQPVRSQLICHYSSRWPQKWPSWLYSFIEKDCNECRSRSSCYNSGEILLWNVLQIIYKQNILYLAGWVVLRLAGSHDWLLRGVQQHPGVAHPHRQ